MNLRRSGSSWQSVKTSSNWSTTRRRRESGGASTSAWRTARRNRAGSERRSSSIEPLATPPVSATRMASSSRGCGPGVSRIVVQAPAPGRVPLQAAGNRPARSTEDLPEPDGPTTAKNGVSASRMVSSATNCSRPKNHLAFSAWNAVRPMYGARSPSTEGGASSGASGRAAAAGVGGGAAARMTRRCRIRFVFARVSRARSVWWRCSTPWRACSRCIAVNVWRASSTIQPNSTNADPYSANASASACWTSPAAASRATSTPSTRSRMAAASVRSCAARSSPAWSEASSSRSSTCWSSASDFGTRPCLRRRSIVSARKPLMKLVPVSPRNPATAPMMGPVRPMAFKRVGMQAATTRDATIAGAVAPLSRLPWRRTVSRIRPRARLRLTSVCDTPDPPTLASWRQLSPQTVSDRGALRTRGTH